MKFKNNVEFIAVRGYSEIADIDEFLFGIIRKKRWWRMKKTQNQKDQEEVLNILVKFDVKAFMNRMRERTGCDIIEYEAIISMHKARIKLAQLGHIDDRRARDSARWLTKNGFNTGLPDAIDLGENS